VFLPLIRLSDRCLAIGIVLLIALPVLRVALMTGVFLLEKDYPLSPLSLVCGSSASSHWASLLGTIKPAYSVFTEGDGKRRGCWGNDYEKPVGIDGGAWEGDDDG